MSSASTENPGEDQAPPATLRLFFALWPPTEAASELGRVAGEAASRYGGRPIRPAAIHLTLAFLGEVPESSLPVLKAAAQTVRANPFELVFDRLGYWPRNHLLWAGCEASPAALDGLYRGLQLALAGAGFCGDHESRRFKPHITLVRNVSRNRCPDRMTDTLPIDPLGWPCSQFVLVRSQLSAEGSSYQIVGEFPLAGLSAEIAPDAGCPG